MALKKITEVDILPGASLSEDANYYVEQNGSFYRVSKSDLEEFLLGKLKHNALSVYATNIVSGSAVYIADGADNIPMKSFKVNIVPVQSGSGDPSPSNVRQISGWDSVNVVKCGKNLAAPFDDSTGTVNGMTYTYSDNVITFTGTTTQQNTDTPNKYLGGAEPIPIIFKAGVTYTASLKGRVNTGGKSLRLMLKYNTILKAYYNSSNGVWRFTPNEDLIINQVAIRVPLANVVLDVEAKLQIEVGSVSTDFEEYTGDVYDISLASAGTVYGGTLDAVSWVLTVDRVAVAMETLTWNRTTSYANPIFYATVSGKASDYRKASCSILRDIGTDTIIAAQGFASRAIDGDFASSNGNEQIYARLDSATTVQDFVTAITGQTLVYPLATPLTYQLSAQEIKSLLGINNIWSYAGDVDIEYRACIKRVETYIDKTLTIDGKVADAKVTGNEIQTLNNRISKIITRLSEIETKSYVHLSIDSFMINVDSDGICYDNQKIRIEVTTYKNGEIVAPTSASASDFFMETYDANTNSWMLSGQVPARSSGTIPVFQYSFNSNDRITRSSGDITITVVSNGVTYTRNVPYTIVRG